MDKTRTTRSKLSYPKALGFGKQTLMGKHRTGDTIKLPVPGMKGVLREVRLTARMAVALNTQYLREVQQAIRADTETPEYLKKVPTAVFTPGAVTWRSRKMREEAETSRAAVKAALIERWMRAEQGA